MGWGPETYLLAEQVDADKALLAIKTHRGRGNVKFPDPTYRPKVKAKEPIETPTPKSLDDFDIKGLLAAMGTG